jgi:rod shape-determining protein MreC
MFSQLARLVREKREFSTFLACSVLSFACLGLPPSVKDGLSVVLSGAVLGPFKRLATTAVELAHVREENASLRSLASGLATERAGLLELRHENDRLKELLRFLVAFPGREHFVMLPARVVGMPGGRIIERMDIDCGSTDGVGPGMPVIVPQGLVGKVVRVFPTRSQVEPLASASSAVSVVIERSRVRGIVRPRYGSESQLLAWGIDYVPARSDVREGDLVITSGLGGVYPPGLSVGSVSSVVDGPVTMTVAVRPAVDLALVEQVFIIVGTSDAALGDVESEIGPPQGPPLAPPWSTR